MRSSLTKKWLIKKKVADKKTKKNIKQGERKRLKKIQLGRKWLKNTIRKKVAKKIQAR